MGARRLPIVCWLCLGWLLAPTALHAEWQAPASASVLLIGDSHAATTFGRALDLLLRSLDVQVTTVASCGVSPRAFLDGLVAQCGYLQIESGEPDWVVVKRHRAQTPRLRDLLDSTRPILTIVELGANQIHSAWREPERASEEIRRVVDNIHDAGSACLWVGPPAGRDTVKPHEKIARLYEILQATLGGRCALLDSRPSAMPFLDYERLAPAAGDGRHWDAIGIAGQQAARRWALEVFRAAEHLLRGRLGAERLGAQTQPAMRLSTTSRPENTLELRWKAHVEALEGLHHTVSLISEGGEARAPDAQRKASADAAPATP